MSLEEEITTCQFGQDVYPVSNLVEPFERLDEGSQYNQLFGLHSFLQRIEPDEARLEQVLKEETKLVIPPVVVMRRYALRSRTRRILQFLEGDYKDKYASLLAVFKTCYQGRYISEKANPSKWWYRDLSNPAVVQEILADHQRLIDELYHHPSFSSEFVCLAKLWHEEVAERLAESQQLTPKHTAPYSFVTYEEISEQFGNVFYSRNAQGRSILVHSLRKALSAKYKLDYEDAIRAISEVTGLHLRRKYNIESPWL